MKSYARQVLFPLLVLLTAFPLAAVPDEFIQLKSVDVKAQGKWLQATVSFTARRHPNPQGALNDQYVDDLKLGLQLCYHNKSREAKLRRERKQFAEPDTYDYYGAEVEIPTVKVGSTLYRVSFLLPATLADRDGYLSSAQRPKGYVVSITSGGVPFELKDPVKFGNYKQASVLESFKKFSTEGVTKTKGLMVPAHWVSPAYLEGAPPLRIRESTPGL